MSREGTHTQHRIYLAYVTRLYGWRKDRGEKKKP
jgi:hypothetical protein